MKNCRYNKEVARAIFRRPPIRIPAIFYDYNGEELSFYNNDIDENSKATRVGFRLNDNTDIRL